MSGETELIKERLDLAEVVGEYVRLKRAGNHYKGLCPFHQEKTPSFIVSPDKGIWHCFGCNEGGDVFSFIQKMEGIEFPAALKLMADRAGVQIEKVNKESVDKRQRLFDLLDLTARFYNELLMNQPVGKKAKEYLKERGLKEKAMNVFCLGYAPKQWDVLQSFLRARSFSPIEMQAAGVVGEGRTGKLYDRFRGRIMFPIYDLQGRVVAFGGRIAPWCETGEEGKYINSPETELYEKRRVVYNLERAKYNLRGGALCVVVEGYMDVIMMDQTGIKNVVASSGTAFTEEQMERIGRFTKELNFCFDADEAGVKAAVAATSVAMASGFRVGTVLLPGGADPADLAKDKPDVLKKYISDPKSIVDLLLERIGETQNSLVKEESVDKVLTVISRAGNPVYQGEMIQELARVLHVPEERIVDMVQKKMKSEANLSLKTEGVDKEEETGDSNSNLISVEGRLMGLLIAFPEVRRKAMKELDEGLIFDKRVLLLYKIMDRLAVKRADSFYVMLADKLLNKFDSEQLSQAEALRRFSEEIIDQTGRDPNGEAEELLAVLKKRACEAELRRLQGRLAGGNSKEKEKILEKIKSLAEQLAQAGRK